MHDSSFVDSYNHLISTFDLAKGLGPALPVTERQALVKSFLHLLRDTAPDTEYPNDEPLLTDLEKWSPRQRLDAWLRIAELEEQQVEKDRWNPPDLYALIPIAAVETRTDRSEQVLFSKYPVTCAQYQRFVDDKANYADQTLWGSLTIYDYSRSQSIAVGEAAQRWFARKDYSRLPLFGEDKQDLETKNIFNPVTVNWYEAAAFCMWLNRNPQSGYHRWISESTEYRGWLLDSGKRVEFRLALEHEWVAAAGGDANGRYVWQKQDDDEVTSDTIRYYANTVESRLDQSTPVFMFPAGASAYGVMDLSGNSREWVGNYFEYPNTAACRGSNPSDTYRGTRAAERLGLPLDNRGVGFRVVCVIHST